MLRRSALLILLLVLVGCDDRERIAHLEKQNQEMQESLAKEKAAVTDFDLQGKCAKDAREWFGRNYQRDKDTLYLNFTNHYNKAQNKCFIVPELHYDGKLSVKTQSIWYNDMGMFDIYENQKLGEFMETTTIFLDGSAMPKAIVMDCIVTGDKCKTQEEFNNLTAKFMTQ